MTIRVIRAGEHVHHIGLGISVREGGVAVAAANWWEVPGKTCVAAYQPKGAASYAASKVNLANPGTYDATDGAAYPTWAAATGWTGNGSDQYLVVGYPVPNDASHSIFVRYSNASINNGCLFGAQAPGGPYLGIQPIRAFNPNTVGYHYGGTLAVSPSLAAGGVLGLAGARAYRNGAIEAGTIASQSGSYGNNINIFRLGGLAPGLFVAATIQALVIYSSVLTETESATVSAAMAAL